MTEVVFAILVICTVMAVSMVGVGENPPAIIENDFKANFKKASKVVWKATASVYIAKFQLNGVKHEAFYTKAGKYILTRFVIPSNELPRHVSSNFDRDFAGQAVSGAFVVIKADGTKRYLIESDLLTAIYAEDGQFIKLEDQCKKERVGIRAAIKKLKIPS